MATVYDPIKIGSLEIKNRLVEAPTVKNFANEDGTINSRYLNNFELESDGPGLIIVSMTFTENQGQAFKAQTGAQNAKSVFGLAELADRIHKQGAKTMLQISHGGNLCAEPIIGEMPVGPSDIPIWPGQTVHALTTEEAAEKADNYGKAAARAQEAGFDGLELHACHGSLILQFLSPIHNQKRTDRYANPPTFLYECIAAVQKYCGKDFPLGVRFTCEEFMEEDTGNPGLKWDDLKVIAQETEKMGVHFIHASAGRIGYTPDRTFPPLYDPRGVNLRFSEEMKKIVNIPVITIGRFQDPIIIEKAVADGKADMVAMCRTIIADPHLPKKMIENRADEVRQCMACNWCLNRLFSQLSVQCPMNPAYGWEKEYELIPAKDVKKVMIIGGGIAGLYAAFAAATRGHNVTVYEKSDKLGGQVKLSSAFPRLYTRELFNLPAWLIKQMDKLKVKILLNSEVDSALIEKENPDAIIVATGAVEQKVNVPMTQDAKVVYLWDYLNGSAQIGDNVVLFGAEAVEAAVSLSREGKKVTLIETGAEVEWPVYIQGGTARREPLMRYLKKGKVDIKYNTSVTEIGPNYVKVNGPEGETTIATDTVVAAIGRVPNDQLFKSLDSRKHRVYLVGDSKEVRSMAPATHEGYWVGRTI